MKIVQIYGGKVHYITPYASIEEAPPFAPGIELAEAPDDVREGWIYSDGTFSEPEPEPVSVETPVTTEELRELMLINMELTLELFEKSEGGAANG